MNAERLLALYERVAEAPDAIARLRRFILDLAVRGKLVPQDPKDEPASELLKRIAQEKVRLVKAGEIKKSEDVAELTASVHHFFTPPGWAITNLQSVCNSVTDGDHLPPPKAEAGVPFLVIGNVRSRNIEFEGSRFVPQSYYEALDPIRRPRSGDLLYTLVGSYGIPIIVRDDQPFCVQRHIGILRPCALMDVNFLARTMESRFVFDQATICATGIAQKTVPLSGLRKLLLPLPPLAEQHRIVAKVDELMALCDQLEAARQEREARRDRLASASLARLNVPNPETFQSDARFTLNALPALTTRPNQIKQLRQTILNLAVRGKLMPQDPQDEPASELLKRITNAKAERKKKTGDARIKIEPDPMPGELDMQLPLGWAVQSFENLFLFIDYRGNTPPKTDDGIPLITAKNIRMGYLNREPREYISKATFKTWMTRGFPEIGDLFFTTEAPLANICLNDIEEPFALAQRVICFQPYAKINTKFLMFALMSDVMQSLIDKHATGMTAKGIKAVNLKPRSIPIPPLAEQHRIVAKVDELMALCDRLEASLTTSDQTRTRLLEATLSHALEKVVVYELAAT
jgi:type I restriction enzyme S subunit